MELNNVRSECFYRLTLAQTFYRQICCKRVDLSKITQSEWERTRIYGLSHSPLVLKSKFATVVKLNI